MARRKSPDWPTEIAGYAIDDCGGKYTYDREAADLAIRFIETYLQHVEGPKAGQPMRLEPWQAAIIRTIIGWKCTDGTRRFRRVFIFLPRKNGKTTLVAALVILILFTDGEAGAQLFGAASSRDQASILYSIASRMLKQSSKLRKLVTKDVDSTKTILAGTSFFRALAAEAGATHGQNAHLVVCDELHTWTDRRFHEALRTSQGARANPLFAEITTAGERGRSELCMERYEYSKRLIDGVIQNEEFLPVIYEAPEDLDWTDPATWLVANPNLGISIFERQLLELCAEAQDNPRLEASFRQLHLNQWVRSERTWLPMSRWEESPAITHDDIPLGAEVFGGMDLGSYKDLTAFAMLHRIEDVFRVRWHFWMPAGQISVREREDKRPYSQWVREGWITPTEGQTVDYSQVRREILAEAKKYKLAGVAYDPSHAGTLAHDLSAEGVIMEEFRQTYSRYNEPTKEFETLVIDYLLDHGGNPVAHWMAENTAVKEDDFARIRPTKREKNMHTIRIDGIQAAIMGLSQMLVYEAPIDPWAQGITWLDM
jgi:phage terminase large subunit-like protein